MNELPLRSTVAKLRRRPQLKIVLTSRIARVDRVALYAMFIAAPVLAYCTDSNVTPGRPAVPGMSSAAPDVPPPGFAMLMLAPTDPPPPLGGVGRDAPSGTIWYRTVTVPGGADATFEWYVRAQHLTPNRAFRIELSVDDRATYSVGSGRADQNGALTAHGVLDRFADEYCVGQPAVPLPVAGRHVLGVSVKADGSRAGGATSGGSLTDPERSLPCAGNGDGAFDYWLTSLDMIRLDPG